MVGWAIGCRSINQYQGEQMTQFSQPRIVVIARAFAIAAHAAVGQRRKYTGEPYHVHPERVAEWVRSAGGDDNMIAAAWLHDVVEDTQVTLEFIEREFGSDIAELVDWLTDSQTPNDGNRATRKSNEAERLGRSPARAQTIKLADLIDNTSSIVTYDPGFARVYLREKEALLEKLRDGDRQLRIVAHARMLNGMDQLGMDHNQ